MREAVIKPNILYIGCVVTLALASMARSADTSKISCEELATSVKLSDTRLKASYLLSESELAAAMMLSDGIEPWPAVALPMCRIEIVITPAPGAEIKSEVWLPDAKKWNGRFLSAGIGGAAGFIDRHQLLAGVAQGYAMSTSDAGSHSPTPLEFTFGRNSEWRKNYAGRGVHLTAITGKALVMAYFHTKPKASLFYGCSGGGYEGLGEAQSYPDDYDGILAGAPAVNWIRQVVWQGMSYVITHKAPGATIPEDKLITINKGVLKQCDALDGLSDGVIDDPRKCKINFKAMQCHGADNSDCFTAPQVKALSALYAPWTNPRTGAFIYPGFTPGAETAPAARTRISSFNGNSVMSPAKPGPLLWHLPDTFQQEDWMTFDFEKGLDAAIAEFEPYDHSKTDMKSFRKSGGKLIIYAGWADPNLNPQSLVNYYESVKKTMGETNTGSFARLFMVPGMNHCSGGPGTNTFGQSIDLSVGDRANANNNIILALDRWVTEGVEPEVVMGTKYVDDKKARGIMRTRPICAYPKVAKWDGKGNPDDAKSFDCVNP
jgi:feruloyl esterase